MSERCERTSERRSGWPSTLRIDFIVILRTVHWVMELGKHHTDGIVRAAYECVNIFICMILSVWLSSPSLFHAFVDVILLMIPEVSFLFSLFFISLLLFLLLLSPTPLHHRNLFPSLPRHPPSKKESLPAQYRICGVFLLGNEISAVAISFPLPSSFLLPACVSKSLSTIICACF